MTSSALPSEYTSALSKLRSREPVRGLLLSCSEENEGCKAAKHRLPLELGRAAQVHARVITLLEQLFGQRHANCGAKGHLRQLM